MTANTKNDPALRPPATRDVIAANRARLAAVDAACTRRPACTVAEAVSMEALEHQYPQVRRILAENNRLRDAAGGAIVDLEALSDSWVSLEAFKARLVLEVAEKLRAAVAWEAVAVAK